MCRCGACNVCGEVFLCQMDDENTSRCLNVHLDFILPFVDGCEIASWYMAMVPF